MLTIINIDRINNSIGYTTHIIVADTHYTFLIHLGNGKKIEVTLSRFKPTHLHGEPHPHNDKYLLQCHTQSWKHYWITGEDIKDVKNITKLIESFLN